MIPVVQELALQLASGPSLGYARTKQAIYAAENNIIEQQLATECAFQRELGRTDDYREGVDAFKTKRVPRFAGR